MDIAPADWQFQTWEIDRTAPIARKFGIMRCGPDHTQARLIAPHANQPPLPPKKAFAKPGLSL
jgi:hypothetical protein